MNTKLDARLRVALDRVRTLWLVVMCVATWLTYAYLPTWCLLLLIPFAFVSRVALVFLLVGLLALTIPQEEIAVMLTPL